MCAEEGNLRNESSAGRPRLTAEQVRLIESGNPFFSKYILDRALSFEVAIPTAPFLGSYAVGSPNLSASPR